MKFLPDGDVDYTDEVYRYKKAVYDCMNANPELELRNYREILKRNGCLDNKGQHFDVDSMDVQCLMAMLVFFNRGEHFGFGLIFDNLKDGVIQRAVDRLKVLTGYKDRMPHIKKNDARFGEVTGPEKSGERTRRAKRPKSEGRFDALFRAAAALEGDRFFEKEKDGHAVYTEAVRKFFDEVDRFFEDDPEYEAEKSLEILRQNGYFNMFDFDVSDKDARCVMALLMKIRTDDQYYDGVLGVMCKKGIVQEAVARLKELEEEKRAPGE
ncbi:MAG: hypothetical protein IK083_05760 [Abditibacteriota bacterium]|nr:hypothetical protein [Abditibacteriota bacterium]